MADASVPSSAAQNGATVPLGIRSGEVVVPAFGGASGLLKNPPVVSSAASGLPTQVRPSAAYVSDGFLYFVCFGNPWGFQVADLSNPAQPNIVGAVTGAVSPLPYKVRARTDLGVAWVCTNSGAAVRKYDVSTPSAPVQVASTNCGAQPFGIDVNQDGSLVAVATTSGGTGLRIIDTSTNTIIGSLVDGVAYADVAIEGDFVYASAFSAGAMRVIDISVPSSPVARGQVTGLTGSIRRILVRNGIVYLLCRDVGPQGGLLYVIDAQNPDTPVLAKTINCPNTSDEANLEFNGSVLWTTQNGGAPAGQQLRGWALADPLTPQLIRSIQYTGTDFVFGIATNDAYLYACNRRFAPDNRVFTVQLQ